MTAMEGQVTGSSTGELATPAPTMTFRDSRILTKWLKASLCFWMIINLIGLASDVALLHFFQDVQQGAYSSRAAMAQDAVVLDEISQVVRIGDFVLFLITAVLFLTWVYRTCDNARRLGAVDMDQSPGWAVGSFFVPLINLLAPYYVMRDIWNASSDPTNWRSMRGNPIVRCWWIIYLASNALAFVSILGRNEARQSVTAAINVVKFHPAVDVGSVVAGVAAFLLVARLSAIQRARASSSLSTLP
jgi:hypothetical protein